MELTFGKYRGESVDDVASDDPAYLRWLLKQDWFAEDRWTDVREEVENALIAEGETEE
jgi:hypothetical protein